MKSHFWTVIIIRTHLPEAYAYSIYRFGFLYVQLCRIQPLSDWLRVLIIWFFCCIFVIWNFWFLFLLNYIWVFVLFVSMCVASMEVIPLDLEPGSYYHNTQSLSKVMLSVWPGFTLFDWLKIEMEIFVFCKLMM